MSTKGISSALYNNIMAKSQYTDSITGDILFDIRARNDAKVSILNLTNYKYKYEITSNKISYTSEKYIFGNQSILFDSNSSKYATLNIKNVNKIIDTDFTISWWQNSSYTNCGGGVSNNMYMYIYSESNNGFGTTFEIPGLEDNVGYKYIRIYNGYNGFADVNSSSQTGNISEFWNNLQNQWIHIAMVKQNSDYKVYVDGELKFTRNISTMGRNLSGSIFSWIALGVCDHFENKKSYYDDFVFINGQALWTSNFEVPNYYLTGDKILSNRFSNKNIIYPTPNDRNDYFDKAYLY